MSADDESVTLRITRDEVLLNSNRIDSMNHHGLCFRLLPSIRAAMRTESLLTVQGFEAHVGAALTSLLEDTASFQQLGRWVSRAVGARRSLHINLDLGPEWMDLPWEWLRTSARPEGEPLVGAHTTLSRLSAGAEATVGPAQITAPGRVLLIHGDGFSGLLHGEKEQRAIQEVWRKGGAWRCDVASVRDQAQLGQALEGGCEVLHVIGTGVAGALCLDKDTRITAEALRSATRGRVRLATLLSVCHGTRRTAARSHLPGVAAASLLTGCVHALGFEHEIGDEVAMIAMTRWHEVFARTGSIVAATAEARATGRGAQLLQHHSARALSG